MSHILSIHDYRFLEKLSFSEHDVLLVAIDNTKIPENIANLNGIKQIVVPRPASERLINARLNEDGLDVMRDWKTSLSEYLSEDYPNYIN